MARDVPPAGVAVARGVPDRRGSGHDPSLPPTVRRLAEHLLDGRTDDPADQALLGWLSVSPPFRAFADRYRDKIRKKLRSVTSPDARLDVMTELHAAQLLLADRRITLEFEPHGSGRGGPDFAITLAGTPSFNVEVTRLHRRPDPTAIGGVLLAKLRQLPPSVANILLVSVASENAGAVDVTGAVQRLRLRADGKDETFFAHRGFDGTRAFYERFLRLGAVLIWCESNDGEARSAAWVNRSARIAVDDRGLGACLASLRAR